MIKNKETIKKVCWITAILLLLWGIYNICMLLLGNVRIKFYGKLVDQNGNPIPNAKIECSATYVYIPLPYGFYHNRSTVTTNSQGRFKFRGRGNDLSVKIPRDHPGYEFMFDENPKTSFNYISTHVRESFVATEVNPFIFTLRKKGMPAYLRGMRGIEIMYNVTENMSEGKYLMGPWIDPNGLPGYLPGGEETEYGQLRRHGNKDLLIEGSLSADGTQYDLEFSPIPSNSGIILSDQFLREVPESGYQSAVQVSISPGTGALKKYLYIKLDDGKFCGRLDVTIDVDSVQYTYPEIQILIDSWINPSGSRNLEYDKAFQDDEGGWRGMLSELRGRKNNFEKVDTLYKEESIELIKACGYPYMPAFRNADQFLNDLYQLRAEKDAQNPQWWHLRQKEEQKQK